MSRESAFTAVFAKVLREQGAIVYPNVAGMGIPIGFPDRSVWHRKWMGAVELKGPTTPITTKQLVTLQKLHAIRPYQAVIFRQHHDARFAKYGFVSYVGAEAISYYEEHGPEMIYSRAADDLEDTCCVHIDKFLEFMFNKCQSSSTSLPLQS